MISILTNGRLGNQLFQYAFGYATARKLGVRFYIDKRFEKYLLTKYFCINKNAFSFLDHHIFSIQGYKRFFDTFLMFGFYSNLDKLTAHQIVEFSDKLPPDIELKKIADHKKYVGFFQSETYFLEYVDEIKKQFTVKEKYSKQFQKLFSTFSKEFRFVVVQVRRTDYINLNISIPVSYFHQAIAKVSHPNNFYILISDDKDFIEKEFHYLPQKYVSRESEIIDFQFLTNADCCIISNSTFGWWGAYLNPKNPEIIAPKYWLGFEEKIEFPAGIIPEKWTTIEV